MEPSLIPAFDVIIAIAFLALSVVTMVCLRVLREMDLQGASRGILAVCVALLSAIGIYHLFPHSYSPAEIVPSVKTSHESLLLPYTALGLALLVLILLLVIAKFFEAFRGCPERFIGRSSREEPRGEALRQGYENVAHPKRSIEHARAQGTNAEAEKKEQ